MLRIYRLVAILSLVIMILVGCKPDKKESNRLLVVTTIGVLADWAREIGGDRVQVVSLLPVSASPHTFEPTPSLAAKTSEADLIVRIGPGLDGWMDGLIPEDAKVIVATEVPGIELAFDHDHADDDEHHHTGANPHVWLDPVYARLICAEIGKAMTELDPEGAEIYAKNLTGYLAKLDSLNLFIEKKVAGFKSREYAAYHPAWMYFALRYGLKRIAVIQQVPGQEPSPRSLDSLIDQIRRQGARVIFAEPQLSPKAAQVIADESGIKVLVLDPLGQEGESYIHLMKRNLEVLASALED